ncbi:aminopeptidase P family protein [Azospirillum fermentarium]|uniref:aminopeptidase P family protein n=1 Tax=Azospirillum fermentarium TaxID=1233114 RepID=UPI00222744F5|nr:aminopeptidase P family protein [Azospirillum fermentarium]
MAAEPVEPAPPPAERLERLRAELRRRSLDGFVVPRADEHQGEYVPARAQRLGWLTGFTGSAGLAVVGPATAALFVDGRYTLQVEAEVDGSLYAFRHLIEDSLSGWVAGAVPRGGRLGYDPWLHPVGWVEKLRTALEREGIDLVPCDGNPVDAVWPGQPPAPLAPVEPHDDALAGMSAGEKRQAVAEALRRDGIGAAILTQPDSIAWLLNIRGGDVPCTPLPLSFAIVDDGGAVDLFIDSRKLPAATRRHLGDGVRVLPPDALEPALDRLGRGGRRVLADPASAAARIFDRLHLAGAHVVRQGDPCALPKACKNPVELDGTRAAHRRDGVAMVRFLRWLDGAAADGTLSESAAADRLLAFRQEGERFRGLSFETISGAGPNGAIVHYRVTPATDRRLEPGCLYLLDSGAQYLDGTTDVTRTIAIGTPTAAMRRHFTLVLKGHIALSQARFPKGTSGSQLDALARMALWQAGLDYDHGTGHGVGSYLSVHEGPQRVAKAPNAVALAPGMILSNEPGYYRTGEYGIRIENLVAVTEPAPVPGGERPMLGFEVLTLVPIDRRLVDAALLSVEETAWLDSYHSRVYAVLAPHLEPGDAAWLLRATIPLAG